MAIIIFKIYQNMVVNLKVTIPGNNEKKGKNYKLETNYMVFPDKKLKMNTSIGGWQK